MSTDTKDANERVALLLGWEREEGQRAVGQDRNGLLYEPTIQWLGPQVDSTRRRDHNYGFAPDYTTWERFPDLQEYVRGLPTIRRQVLWPMVRDAGGIEFHHEALTNITPTILRDAILEVCGGS